MRCASLRYPLISFIFLFQVVQTDPGTSPTLLGIPDPVIAEDVPASWLHSAGRALSQRYFVVLDFCGLLVQVLVVIDPSVINHRAGPDVLLAPVLTPVYQ